MLEYVVEFWQVFELYVPSNIIKILLALLLGLFIGIEREWSDKPAGVRTISLLCVLGSIFAIVEVTGLVISGVLFVIVISVLLGLRNFISSTNYPELSYIEKVFILESHNTRYIDDIYDMLGSDDEDIFESLVEKGIFKDNDRILELTDYGDLVREDIENSIYSGLSLTTSVSLLIAYSIGLLVGYGFFIEAATISIISAMLLLLKNELHTFAWGLSKEELKSAVWFSIIAFLVFPVLPEQTVGPFDSINPVVVWTLIVAVSAIGFVNYVLIKLYESEGLIVSSFLAGLINSTTVAADVSSKSGKSSCIRNTALGCVTISNAAMSLRNAVVLLIFIPSAFIMVGLPLLTVFVSGMVLSYVFSDWSDDIDISGIKSPFSLRNSFSFGFLFLIVIVLSSFAEVMFGNLGFVAAAFASGLVSSGTATTTAVALYLNGQIGVVTASAGVLMGTISSLFVKFIYVLNNDRKLAGPVLKLSFIMSMSGLFVFIIVLVFEYLIL